jgi:hypothetical protein
MDQPAFDARSCEYDAFVCYRRSDGGALAQWLRKALQSYRLPKEFVGGEQRLRIYIDTSYERANEDFWRNNIEPALKRSLYLIVVLTPTSSFARGDGTQNWLEREVEFFCRLPQGNNVLAVAASGEHVQNLPATLKKEFPNLSVVVFEDFSRWRLSPQRFFSLRQSLLTLVASLYQIQETDMPVLRQEEKWRKRQTLWIGFAALFVFISVSSLVSYILLSQRNERIRLENRAQAVQTIYAQQQFIMQLRLAVLDLDHDARNRGDAESRNGFLSPFNRRLDSERAEMERLLVKLKDLTTIPGDKWQRLYDDLVRFLEDTKDSRRFSLEGFNTRQVLEKELNELDEFLMYQLEGL